MNPFCTEALVARGASLSYLSKYEDALSDFYAALKINPSELNAKKYIELTKYKKEKSGVSKVDDKNAAGSSRNLVLKPQYLEYSGPGSYGSLGKSYKFEFEASSKRAKRDEQ
jgi:hypothetical protein